MSLWQHDDQPISYPIRPFAFHFRPRVITQRNNQTQYTNTKVDCWSHLSIPAFFNFHRSIGNFVDYIKESLPTESLQGYRRVPLWSVYHRRSHTEKNAFTSSSLNHQSSCRQYRRMSSTATYWLIGTRDFAGTRNEISNIRTNNPPKATQRNKSQRFCFNQQPSGNNQKSETANHHWTRSDTLSCTQQSELNKLQSSNQQSTTQK